MVVNSYGLMVFSKIKSSNNRNFTFIELEQPEDAIKILLIQRKHSMAYNSFIRGRYFKNDKDSALKSYFEEMTPEERYKVSHMSFEDLWNDVWSNKSSRYYRIDKQRAKENFTSVDKKKYIENTSCLYKRTEIEIPKGRRNKNETVKQCAVREFVEETGYKNTDITILDVPPIEEKFKGTNNVIYSHLYFIALLNDCADYPRVDKNNAVQMEEVKNIDFVEMEVVENILRPYDDVKKNIIYKGFCIVKDML